MENNALIPPSTGENTETLPNRDPEIEILVREKLGSGIPEERMLASIKHAQGMYKIGRDLTRLPGETEEDVWKDFTSYIFKK